MLINHTRKQHFYPDEHSPTDAEQENIGFLNLMKIIVGKKIIKTLLINVQVNFLCTLRSQGKDEIIR